MDEPRGTPPDDAFAVARARPVERIRETLEQAILLGELVDGERLDETRLAARFGVSRTPVREALSGLAAAGLVEHVAHRGAFARVPGAVEVAEMFEVMAELEALCARLGATRATPVDHARLATLAAACEAAAAAGDTDHYYRENERLHGALYALCGNGFLAEQAGALQRRLRAHRRLQLRAPRRLGESVAEHRAILAALRAGRAEEAAALARDHVGGQGRRFEAFAGARRSAPHGPHGPHGPPRAAAQDRFATLAPPVARAARPPPRPDHRSPVPMFELLDAPKPDAILALMAAFREDARTDKLDLGVGIYKDASGATPVMSAVRTAERRLLETQTTKAYVGPVGSRPFAAAMIDQVFGDGVDRARVRAAQSVGGSGALRVLADLLREARPEARIHVSDPSWPNHVPLLGAAGFEIRRYPYYDAATGAVAIEPMLEALGRAEAGDVVVLHGCCHNPTGADPSAEQWERIIDTVAERGLFPFVDLAYQGFGDGLEEDAWSVRALAARVPEMAVAASCSKNFGLYRERVGAAIVVAEDGARADLALGRLSGTIRANYSMPPDHGANATHLVLEDPALAAEWREELESMRVRMQRSRTRLADALRMRSNSGRFDFVAHQKGMFSRLPLGPDEIRTLRERHGVYVVGDGRINVAGLPDEDDRLAALAEAIVSVDAGAADAA